MLPLSLGASVALGQPDLIAEGDTDAICRAPAPDHTLEGGYTVNLWPNGVVPFVIDDNISAENRLTVEATIARIEEVSSVRFVNRTNEPNSVRIRNSTTGSFASVGMIGGEQTVNIQHWSIAGLVMHEMLHMLGLYHEQQRPDRADAINVLNINILRPQRLQFQRIGSAVPVDRFDYASIMLYPQAAATANGLKTIEVLEPWRRAWQHRLSGSVLSAGDIRSLWAMYGGEEPPSYFDLATPRDRASFGAEWIPEFSWIAAEAATTYRLLVDRDPHFRTPVIDVELDTKSYVHSATLEPGHVYFWSVIASNNVGSAPPHPIERHSFFVGDALPQTVYVDSAAAPGGTGESWDDALRELSDALAIAGIAEPRATEIRIAGGSYAPGRATGDRHARFSIPGGAKLLGGYAGKSDPELRDHTLYETVFTGDPLGDDSVGQLNDNAYSVAIAHAAEAPIVIDGVTFTGAIADGTRRAVIAERQAAGLMIDDAEVHISNCTFRNLTAMGGAAALYVWQDATVRVKNCVFEDNDNVESNANASVVIFGAALARFESCVFSRNAGGLGGAIRARRSPNIEIVRTFFSDNRAERAGGALYLGDTSTVTASHARFLGNRSGIAAGVFLEQNSTVDIIQSLATGNSATGSPGLIQVEGGSAISIEGSTIVDNASSDGVVVAVEAPPGATPSSFSVTNSVVWNHDDPTAALTHVDEISSAVYAFSLIPVVDGPGMMNSDPQLENPASGDYRPAPRSLLIDAGSVSLISIDVADADNDSDVTEQVEFDLAGEPRRLDDPGAIDAGEGSLPIVDVGAFERMGTDCIADMNGDGFLDYQDVIKFLTDFESADTSADLNGDGKLDYFDVSEFLAAYQAGCPL